MFEKAKVIFTGMGRREVKYGGLIISGHCDVANEGLQCLGCRVEDEWAQAHRFVFVFHLKLITEQKSRDCLASSPQSSFDMGGGQGI